MNVSEDKFTLISKNIVLNKNELNNIVFLCLKYGFGGSIPELKEPSNQDIKTLIFELNEDPTPSNIIDKIISFVVEKFGPDSIDNRAGHERYMMSVIKDFMNQPYKLRNDLGDDTESDDLITRH